MFLTDGKAEAHHYCAWPRSHLYIKMTGSKRPYNRGRRYVCGGFLGGEWKKSLLFFVSVSALDLFFL